VLPCDASRLEHETRIYAQLETLQGSAIPVHLGLIDMGIGYILPGAEFITHMMMMSWGGELAISVKDHSELWAAKARSFNEIRALGVVHGDRSEANTLWNAECGRALIIDFDHASIVEDKPQPSPQKKQKREANERNNRQPLLKRILQKKKTWKSGHNSSAVSI